jgi:hypothetical protein
MTFFENLFFGFFENYWIFIWKKFPNSTTKSMSFKKKQKEIIFGGLIEKEIPLFLLDSIKWLESNGLGIFIN